MKTALIAWNDRIAPVFDTAREAVVIETGGREITGRETIRLPEGNPLDKIAALVEAGVSVVICGAISNPFRYLAMAYGVTICGFIAGDIDAVIEAWLGNKLDRSAFAMPGCGRRCRRGRGRGRCDSEKEGASCR